MMWAVLIVAALLIGISKTSVGGLGSVSVAMFALVLPTKESTAAVLLLLIVGDIVAVIRYRAHADWKLLFGLLPWVLPGLGLGALFLRSVVDRVLTKVIAAILLVMLAIQVITRWVPQTQKNQTKKTRTKKDQSADEGTSWAQTKVAAGGAGMLAGFTTMTANAAGPVMTLYLLAAKVDKLRFVGTGAWYFLIINCTKVPFSAALGLFTRRTLVQDLLLAPVVLVGTWLGAKLLAWMPQKVFENVAIAASAVGAVSLLLK